MCKHNGPEMNDGQSTKDLLGWQPAEGLSRINSESVSNEADERQSHENEQSELRI
jgi:hypothetical protein